MAPMIDMVFLLLVFFMCVSTISGGAARVPAELAESVRARVPKELARRLPVTVLAGGAVFVGAAEVPADGLEARLREEFRREPRLLVNVRAEGAVPFEAVKAVLRAAAAAGAGDVVFAAFEAP